MTYTSLKQTFPSVVSLKQASTKANLIIKGQGVVFFDASGPCSLRFVDASGVGIKLDFKEGSIEGKMEPSEESLIDPTNSKGIVPQKGAYYWVSLDAQNQRLYAGIGEGRIETATYKYTFSSPTKQWLECLVAVEGEHLQITKILRDPITRNVPLHVKSTEELTMDVIAEGSVLPVASLSPTAQQLYYTIAGKNFILNTSDFPEFTQAIEHSIATQGCWCYERLKQKATEFDKDKPNPSETYLRITLGENNGESPGIPYVMEIWPVGHFSPIHNHGGASAVIRVLNGSIQVSLFPFLSEDVVEPFGKVVFRKGDVTWISPTLNQVHQLKNLETNKDTCITIQCYMYEQDDKRHYDDFDYREEGKPIQQFEPDSDMDFVEFKKTMKKEWAQQVQVQPGCWERFLSKH
jgi:predicted metal-dependent enzyme (double-stranded beta helix superfamily)